MAIPHETDNLEGIPAVFHAEYTKAEDGKYRLNVTGLPDVAGLKESQQKLLAEKKAAAEAAKKAMSDAEKIKLDAAKAAGDSEALIKSYEDKIASLSGESETALKTLTEQLNKLTSGETATKIAASLARTVKGSDGKDYSTIDVLEPLIKARLKTEIKDGNLKVVVLDKNGMPSAATIEDLKNEIINNPSYSPLISGSKASGAGNQGAGPSGGVDKDIMKLPPIERMNAAREAAKNKK